MIHPTSAKMASSAWKSMVDHADELGTALSSEPMGVAGVLFDKNLIKNEVLQEMMEVDTPRARVDVLVQAVINLIAAAPEKFKEFLEIISDQSWGREVASKLHSTHQCKPVFANFVTFITWLAMITMHYLVELKL